VGNCNVSFHIFIGTSPKHDENMVAVVERSPHQSTRKISSQLGVPRMSVRRKLNFECFYPYHIHPIQYLEPWDCDVRLQFCRWIDGEPELCSLILFTDEAQHTPDGVNNTHNTHPWSPEKPHNQHKFSINVWCGIISNKLIAPHIFEGRLTV
jgi:hypothetical protein